MRLSPGDKTFRVIRFLLGLRNPRIATALAGYGFKQEDRDEGWALINALGKGKLEVLPTEAHDLDTLLKLDAWQNQWFPIAQAALDRRFPAVSGKFFLNLFQTEGPAVAISVRTFVERYAELGAGGDKYGAEGAKTLELLVTRGITAAVIAEAQLLLIALTQVAPSATTPLTEEQDGDLEQAEAAMWAWYLEWSQIARVAIKQRSLLKELGFLATRRAGEDDGEGETGASLDTPPSPPPASVAPAALGASATTRRTT